MRAKSGKKPRPEFPVEFRVVCWRTEADRQVGRTVSGGVFGDIHSALRCAEGEKHRRAAVEVYAVMRDGREVMFFHESVGQKLYSLEYAEFDAYLERRARESGRPGPRRYDILRPAKSAAMREM